MSLSVEKVRLSDIKKTNTELRLHPPAQRKKARKLFERQGIVAPIILDERFNICLSPLELCQYILAKGVRKHGSKALF